jgi:putative ABC transport system permease protein
MPRVPTWMSLLGDGAKRSNYALATCASVAIGVTASAVVASCLDALLFAPIGVQGAKDIVQITTVDERQAELGVPRLIADQLGRDTSLNGVCAFTTPLMLLSVSSDVREVSGLTISQECTSTLALKAVLGRLLRPEDFRPGADSVALLTYQGWQRLFSGEPDAVGHDVTVGGLHATIIGVTSRDFRGLLLGFPALLIRPMLSPTVNSSLASVNVIGRLPPGRSLTSVGNRLRAEWPALSTAANSPRLRDMWRRQNIVVRAADTGVDFALRSRFASPLETMLLLSVGVLAMASLNLVQLVAARRLTGHHDLAMQSVLGARPARLIVQTFVSDLRLIAIGVVSALPMSYGVTTYVLSWLRYRYRGLEFATIPSFRVVILAACLGLLLAAIAAATSSWYILQSGSAGLLSQRSYSSSIRAVARARTILAIVQVSCSQALVLIALTISTGLAQIATRNVGFVPRRVVSAQLIATVGRSHSHGSPANAYRSLLDGLVTRPDISSAALAASMPFQVRPLLADVSWRDRGRNSIAEIELVTHDFFSALGIRLTTGRSFAPESHDGVAETVLSTSLSRDLFGDSLPIGATIETVVSGMPVAATVVGIAPDIAIGDPRVNRRYALYLNALRFPDFMQAPALLVTGPAPTETTSRVVRDYLKARDDVAATRIDTLATELAGFLVQERLLSVCATGFAAVSLALSTLGLYGLSSRTVRDRRHEIGVRLALGAQRRDILRIVVGHAITTVGVGTALCVPVAWALHASLRARIPGVPSLDIFSLVLPGTAALSAVLASVLPALRAAAVDPSALVRGDLR